MSTHEPPADEQPPETSGHSVSAEDRKAHEAAASNALLRADEVVAGYVPGVNILNGCDFYVNDGELVGIIGPNGAGKSTLLKAIFGLIKVSSGTIMLRGEDITGYKANKLVTQGRRLRPADQQRVPQPDHRGEPADGGLPGPEEVQEELRVRHRPVPGAGRPSRPARGLALRR